MRLIVHEGARAVGAEAEAVDRLHRDLAVRRRAVPIDAEAGEDIGVKSVRSHGLAGLGAAQLHLMLARGGTAEVVVERDAAMHLGPRQVQRVRDEWNGALVDVAKGFLQGVEDGERGAFEMRMVGDDAGRTLRAPWLMLQHCSYPDELVVIPRWYISTHESIVRFSRSTMLFCYNSIVRRKNSE